MARLHERPIERPMSGAARVCGDGLGNFWFAPSRSRRRFCDAAIIDSRQPACLAPSRPAVRLGVALAHRGLHVFPANDRGLARNLPPALF
jgi:hypothetical protein